MPAPIVVLAEPKDAYQALKRLYQNSVASEVSAPREHVRTLVEYVGDDGVAAQPALKQLQEDCSTGLRQTKPTQLVPNAGLKLLLTLSAEKLKREPRKVGKHPAEPIFALDPADQAPLRQDSTESFARARTVPEVSTTAGASAADVLTTPQRLERLRLELCAAAEHEAELRCEASFVSRAAASEDQAARRLCGTIANLGTDARERHGALSAKRRRWCVGARTGAEERGLLLADSEATDRRLLHARGALFEQRASQVLRLSEHRTAAWHREVTAGRFEAKSLAIQRLLAISEPILRELDQERGRIDEELRAMAVDTGKQPGGTGTTSMAKDLDTAGLASMLQTELREYYALQWRLGSVNAAITQLRLSLKEILIRAARDSRWVKQSCFLTSQLETFQQQIGQLRQLTADVCTSQNTIVHNSHMADCCAALQFVGSHHQVLVQDKTTLQWKVDEAKDTSEVLRSSRAILSSDTRLISQLSTRLTELAESSRGELKDEGVEAQSELAECNALFAELSSETSELQAQLVHGESQTQRLADRLQLERLVHTTCEVRVEQDESLRAALQRTSLLFGETSLPPLSSVEGSATCGNDAVTATGAAFKVDERQPCAFADILGSDQDQRSSMSRAVAFAARLGHCEAEVASEKASLLGASPFQDRPHLEELKAESQSLQQALLQDASPLAREQLAPQPPRQSLLPALSKSCAQQMQWECAGTKTALAGGESLAVLMLRRRSISAYLGRCESLLSMLGKAESVTRLACSCIKASDCAESLARASTEWVGVRQALSTWEEERECFAEELRRTCSGVTVDESRRRARESDNTKLEARQRQVSDELAAAEDRVEGLQLEVESRAAMSSELREEKRLTEIEEESKVAMRKQFVTMAAAAETEQRRFRSSWAAVQARRKEHEPSVSVLRAGVKALEAKEEGVGRRFKSDEEALVNNMPRIPGMDSWNLTMCEARIHALQSELVSGEHASHEQRESWTEKQKSWWKERQNLEQEAIAINRELRALKSDSAIIVDDATVTAGEASAAPLSRLSAGKRSQSSTESEPCTKSMRRAESYVQEGSPEDPECDAGRSVVVRSGSNDQADGQGVTTHVDCANSEHIGADQQDAMITNPQVDYSPDSGVNLEAICSEFS